jgi:hypothetical protein
VHEIYFIIYPGLVEYFVYSSPPTKYPFLDCEPVVNYPDVQEEEFEEQESIEGEGFNYYMDFNKQSSVDRWS